MSQAAGQSRVRSRASLPPSQKITDPQKNAASGPSRNSTSAAISSGRPGRPSRDGEHVEERAGLRIRPHGRHHRGVDHPGGDGVEPEARPGPGAPRRFPPDPVGQRQLGGGVRQQGTAGVGDTPAQLLVVVEAGVDQVGGDTGLHRGGVRADGHGGTPRSQQRSQPLEHVDGAEVIHGREQRPGAARIARQPGAGHDAGQRPVAEIASLRDRPVAPLGRPQVRHHVGRHPVDADDAPPGPAQPCGGGGPDARGGTGDDDDPFRQLVVPSGRRAPCRRANSWRPRCG